MRSLSSTVRLLSEGSRILAGVAHLHPTSHFEDAEFASQARKHLLLSFIASYPYPKKFPVVLPTVFAAFNLLAAAAAALVTSSPAVAAQLPPLSTFNRYTRSWYSSYNAYKRIAMQLTFLSYTEVLIEIDVQKKWGTKAKWRLCPPAPDRYHHDQHKNGSANGHAGGEHNGDANMNRKPKHADVTEFLLSKVITSDHLKKPADLVRILKGLGRVGEYLFIIRPLIYGLSLFSLSSSYSASMDHLSSHFPVAHTVLAIIRYGRRSWYPWLLSLSMELASRGATRHHFSPYDSFRTTIEKEEASRKVLLLLYTQRTILYEIHE
ncbi:hypothetical protein BC938DRAFT_477146, partial [Jimgerdemannia flammicorona]